MSVAELMGRDEVGGILKTLQHQERDGILHPLKEKR
jgi:hypothetical protein